MLDLNHSNIKKDIMKKWFTKKKIEKIIFGIINFKY